AASIKPTPPQLPLAGGSVGVALTRRQTEPVYFTNQNHVSPGSIKRMSDLLEPPALQQSIESAAHRLRATMAAVRLAFTWFGTRKTLTQEQTCQAADTF